MLEICGYNKENKRFKVINWNTNKTEEHSLYALKKICKEKNIKILGMLNSDVVICPIGIEFDDETVDGYYEVLNPPASWINYIESKGEKYTSKTKFIVHGSKSLYSGNIKVDVRYKYQYLPTKYIVRFEARNEIDLGEMCIELVSNYRHPEYKHLLQN